MDPPPKFTTLNEEVFEQNIINQVDALIKEKTEHKYLTKIRSLDAAIEKAQLDILELANRKQSRATERQLASLYVTVEESLQEKEELQRLLELEQSGLTETESERDFLIRTGQLNPLDRLPENFKAAKSDLDANLSIDSLLSIPTVSEVNIIEDSLQDALDENSEPEVDQSEPVCIDGQYFVSVDIWSNLFNYQRTGIKWLWELHKQNVGGILGDEMGLGKTLQCVGFLAGLLRSGMWEGCSLVVCPATVLKQWAHEFKRWKSYLKTSIFHNSAVQLTNPSRTLSDFRKDSKVIITTYSLLQIYQKNFLKYKWFYVILDEGHKIRNPEANITGVCKALLSTHKICVTGTPIQNNLIELWSLFDFIFPGKLGSLQIFQNEFAVPINMGGYSNAGPLQIQTSYKCACTLRDMIRPYLLRRWKKDVAKDLPLKEEHICFCRITSLQRKIYEDYLASGQLAGILAGQANMLCGIDVLRKICNHPYLLRSTMHWTDWMDAETAHLSPEEITGKYGVMKDLLQLWKRQDRKALIFCQTRQMLDLLENYLKCSTSYSYLRMDGQTDISKRAQLVDTFNANENIFIFLLTTRVGGLGINLTSASRVIIYDPDWNPSTDLQARERAWRLGQKKDVQIFRFLTVGTIEEKIYHRQVFKQILTNRILQNPKLSRFFKPSDIHDLFSLAAEDASMNYDSKIMLKDKNTSRKRGPLAGDEDFHAEKKSADVPEDILESIFSASGVTTQAHDDVVNNFSTPDVKFLDQEAEKIVSRSLQLLHDSNPYQKYILSKNLPLLTPADETSILGPMVPTESSQMLLTNLSTRSTPMASLTGSVASQSAYSEVSPLAVELVEYFKRKGGSATTDDILNHFQSKISPDEAVLFKKLLKNVATLTSTATSNKIWILKHSL